MDPHHCTQDVTYRRISPTAARVARCTLAVLKQRLKALEGAVPGLNKAGMVNALVEALTDNMTLVELMGGGKPAHTTPNTNTNTTPTDTSWCVGDCLEVFWTGMDQWFPCVVKKTITNADGSQVWLCHYDGEAKGRWHDLGDEQTRRIDATSAMVTRVTSAAIRDRLKLLAPGRDYPTSTRKPVLVSLLVDSLNADTTTAVNTSTVENDSDTINADITAESTSDVTAAPERAKYGHSHVERMGRLKRKHADQELLDQERELFPRKKYQKRETLQRQRVPDTSESTPYTKMTCTQTVEAIGNVAQALWTLSTTGSRRDDRQHEREGYNLLVFRQSKFTAWDADAHVWQAGESDMTLLPSVIRACYDTTGWLCINTYSDKDGVVFLRPSPPLCVRGRGAARRRTNFKWTDTMGKWLHANTAHLSAKSLPLAQLAESAFKKWGHLAPEQEHILNRIKGRDKAKKEGRPPPSWVTQAEASN